MTTSTMNTALKKTVLIAVALLLAATAMVATTANTADARGGVVATSNGGPLVE